MSLRGEQPVLLQSHLARLDVCQIRARAYHPRPAASGALPPNPASVARACPAAATLAELQELLDGFGRSTTTADRNRALGRRTPDGRAPEAPEGATVNDVASAHEADLRVQGKFGVNYINYWVDKKRGKVFCLVEAPEAEAATACHREAHGLIADEAYEVVQG